MKTSKMTRIERTGKLLFVCYLSRPKMIVNVKIVMMEHLWCAGFLFVCLFVFLLQKWLLLNIHIGYLSDVTPSSGCLTLRFLDRGSL